MLRLLSFVLSLVLMVGMPSASSATETSTTSAITPARHSVQPTGRDVFLTHDDCERAKAAGNIAGYGPSTSAIRSAVATNARAGLTPVFSDQVLADMRARGESLQGCALENTSVYTDGHEHSSARGQTQRGRFWVVKNLEDIYTRAGRYFDWWCANPIVNFPQPREDVATSDVAVQVERPAPRRVQQMVPVIVEQVPVITYVCTAPARMVNDRCQLAVPAPTMEVVYEEQEDCGCEQEEAPVAEERQTYTVREWHRCGERIGDMIADHDGYYIVTYER